MGREREAMKALATVMLSTPRQDPPRRLRDATETAATGIAPFVLSTFTPAQWADLLARLARVIEPAIDPLRVFRQVLFSPRRRKRFSVRRPSGELSPLAMALAYWPRRWTSASAIAALAIEPFARDLPPAGWTDLLDRLSATIDPSLADPGAR